MRSRCRSASTQNTASDGVLQLKCDKKGINNQIISFTSRTAEFPLSHERAKLGGSLYALPFAPWLDFTSTVTNVSVTISTCTQRSAKCEPCESGKRWQEEAAVKRSARMHNRLSGSSQPNVEEGQSRSTCCVRLTFCIRRLTHSHKFFNPLSLPLRMSHSSPLKTQQFCTSCLISEHPENM